MTICGIIWHLFPALLIDRTARYQLKPRWYPLMARAAQDPHACGEAPTATGAH